MNECMFSICFFMYLNVLLSTVSYIVDTLGVGELRVMWVGGRGMRYSTFMWLALFSRE